MKMERYNIILNYWRGANSLDFTAPVSPSKMAPGETRRALFCSQKTKVKGQISA